MMQWSSVCGRTADAARVRCSLWRFPVAAAHWSALCGSGARAVCVGACGKCEHWEDALGLLREMLRGLLTRSVMSRNAAVSACEKGQHWKEACRLLQEMLHGLLSPDVVSYSAVFSACEKGVHW